MLVSKWKIAAYLQKDRVGPAETKIKRHIVLSKVEASSIQKHIKFEAKQGKESEKDVPSMKLSTCIGLTKQQSFSHETWSGCSETL